MNHDPKRWLEDPELDSDLRHWLAGENPAEPLPASVAQHVHQRITATLVAVPVSLEVLSATKTAAGATTGTTGATTTTTATTVAGTTNTAAGTATTTATTNTAASAAHAITAGGASAGGASAGGAAAGISAAAAGTGAASTAGTGLGAAFIGTASAKAMGVLGLVAATATSGYLVSESESLGITDEPSRSAAQHQKGEGTKPSASGPETPGQGVLPSSDVSSESDSLSPAKALTAEARELPPPPRELDLQDLESTQVTSQKPETRPARPTSAKGTGARHTPSPTTRSKQQSVPPNPSRKATAQNHSSKTREADTQGKREALEQELELLQQARRAITRDPQKALQLLSVYDRKFPQGKMRAEYEALLGRLSNP